MKKNKIIFWVSTALISLFIGPGAVFNAIASADSVKFITELGYPVYFVSYLGVLKVLGVIAILIPGYYRIKEWAYAGLVFDLVSATYSIAMAGPDAGPGGWAIMLVAIAILFVSYFYYHKVYNPAHRVTA